MGDLIRRMLSWARAADRKMSTLVDEQHVVEVEEDGVAHFASFRSVASCALIARWTAALTLARLVCSVLTNV